MKRGDLISAFQAAHSASKQFGDTQSEWFWRFRALEAEILMLQGHYQESLDLLDVKLPERLQASDIAAWQRMTQASASASLFRIDAARDYLNEAAKIVESTQPQLLGELTLREGSLAFLAGDSRLAFSKYLATREIARKSKDPFLEAAALGSLGLVSTRLERYDESVDWNKQALQLSHIIGAKNSAARIQGNIGWSYHEMGDLDNALLQFRLAEKEAQNTGNISDQAYWMNSEAGVLYDLHDYTAADSVSKEALSLSQGLNDKRTTVECLQTRALVAMATSHGAEAKKAIDEAVQLQAAARDSNRDLYTALLAAHFVAETQNLLQAERAYSDIVRNRQAPTSLRWEAQASLGQVHVALSRTGLAEREFKGSISSISTARNALQHEEFRLSFLTSAIRFYDAYVNFLIEQKQPLDALKIADLSRAQTLERGLTLSASSAANGGVRLAKRGDRGPLGGAVAFRPKETARKWNATLLFYWLGEQRSHLWVITPAKVSLLPLPTRSEIDARVKSYLEAFLEPRDPLETGNADGEKLYETLIEPAERLIPKNSRVIVLPDGGLNSLNFETLIVPGEKPHYWIEDVTLSTGNSLALLAKTSPTAPPKDARLFLMGDSLQASPDFPPLPQAGKEIGQVQNYFPAGRRSVLTGTQAVPSRFLSGKPEEFSYLHFTTHGTASSLRPLESAVILSPEGDTYKLYARDIVQHPLHAYLVTISACNGSGLRTYAGEGLVGLAWAFLRAGAHNVIAGLWEVSNASTPQLMDELYKGLNAGKDPASALRDAKLTLVHSQGNYKRPFYWAPFQIYAGS